MARGRKGASEALRAESGFTLLELLVASALALVVFLAAASLLGVTGNARGRVSNRSDAVLSARDGLERMTKEARAALAVSGQSPAVSAGSLVFQRVAAGADPDQPLASQAKLWVRWTCASGTCTRTSSAAYPPPAAGGPALVTGVSNSDVLSLTGTNYLGIRLVVDVPKQQAGESSAPRPVELLDGVYMRNVP